MLPHLRQIAPINYPKILMNAGNTPKISIVSAFKNSGQKTLNVLESVRAQTYSNIEHCIVDGMSTDGTLELIRSEAISNSKIVSREDRSISEAWNTGVSLCSGDLISFQGAGDYLDPNACSLVASLYQSSGSTSKAIIVGGCSRISTDGVSEPVRYNKYRRMWRPISMRFWFPSVFIPRSAFDSVGLFDENKKIALDTDWLLRAISNGYHFLYSRHHLSMEAGGISDSSWKRGYLEYLESLEKYNMMNFYDKALSKIYLHWKESR